MLKVILKSRKRACAWLSDVRDTAPLGIRKKLGSFVSDIYGGNPWDTIFQRYIYMCVTDIYIYIGDKSLEETSTARFQERPPPAYPGEDASGQKVASLRRYHWSDRTETKPLTFESHTRPPSHRTAKE